MKKYSEEYLKEQKRLYDEMIERSRLYKDEKKEKNTSMWHGDRTATQEHPRQISNEQAKYLYLEIANIMINKLNEM